MLRPTELGDVKITNSNTEDIPVPDSLFDQVLGRKYIKGRFFGKGGFAKCYEIIDEAKSEVFAGKIVPKKLLKKSHTKEKLVQEIQIHKSLKHKNVVGFHGVFDDESFVYIVLELCRKRSMMELSRRRKVLTEPEVRYFMKQILEGVIYLHDKGIIHRDLKLGNLFIDDEVRVKIGDFGLATKIEFAGQRKTTLCGTPNYIAPEILHKVAHSFEVDVWSIGCIMYALLAGKPPFESGTLKETYSRIKRCEYVLPTDIANLSSGALIRRILQAQPECRPSTRQILQDRFMLEGFMPSQLPLSCLTIAPRIDTLYRQRTPLRNVLDSNNLKPMTAKLEMGPSSCDAIRTIPESAFSLLKNLGQQLSNLFNRIPSTPDQAVALPDLEELTDPEAQPLIWISKWTDYSDKYGFGYQLCDDGVGVMFNDGTRMLLLANQTDLHYISKIGEEHYYTLTSAPSELAKKIKLLSHFRRYMTNNLIKAGEAQVSRRESDRLVRVPYLHLWSRSGSAVVMQLSNGIVQVNFTDHTKVILCPVMSAVSFIDHKQHFFTFRISTVANYITHPQFSQLSEALYYVHKKIPSLMSA